MGDIESFDKEYNSALVEFELDPRNSAAEFKLRNLLAMLPDG